MRRFLPLLGLLALAGCSALGLSPDPADPAAAITPEQAETLGGLLMTVGAFFGAPGLAIAGVGAAGLALYAKKKNAAKTTSATPAAPAVP
jgi:hypothetical protein